MEEHQRQDFVHQQFGAGGVHRDWRGLPRHGDPRGSRQGLRNAAVVRQPQWRAPGIAGEAGVTALLGVGFDPGVVNAYARFCDGSPFRPRRQVDIIDINDGRHGRYFATNFDAEINFREFVATVWSWEQSRWKASAMFEHRRVWDMPVTGKSVTLTRRRDPFAVAKPGRSRHPFLDGLWRSLHQRVCRPQEPWPAVDCPVRTAGASGSFARTRQGGASTPPRWHPTIAAKPASAFCSTASGTGWRMRR